MTVEELVEQWPKRWPRPTIGSTKNAQSQIKPFAEAFRGRDIWALTREEFRRWALENPGRARYVRTMLYDALDAGLVTENVAAGVRLPTKGSRQIDPPKPQEVEELIEAAVRHGYHTFASAIRIAAYCGLREGEIRALALEDVDWEGRRLTIRHSMNRREELVDPKTASSRATCAILGPLTKPDFAEWEGSGTRRTPIRERRLFAWRRSAFRDVWQNVRSLAGVDCRWHDLRHFCATWLLDAGASVDDVALQLRCSVDEVRRRYGHPNRDEALRRLAKVAEP